MVERRFVSLMFPLDRIAWSAGATEFTFTGGWNRRLGRRSQVTVNSIIAVKGHGRHHFAVLLHRDSDHAVESEASIKLRYTSNGRLIKEGALVTR